MDCTLRSLGETSAERAVLTPDNLPDTFVLRVVSDGLEWPCRMASRTHKRVIVEFR